MLWLAFKMMFQERGRLLVALAGIAFSAVLTLVEVAIYIGMMANATGVVRHTDADIWISSKNVPNFDFAQPFPASLIDRVRAFGEVAWADRIQVTYAYLKLHDGRREQVEVIGFNPQTGVGGPWDMAEGVPRSVEGGHYMIMDESARQRLGKLDIGSLWELFLSNKTQSFKLVGLSRQAVSFTTMPVVFTSYNTVTRGLLGTEFAGDTSFIVAKVKDPGAVDGVVRALRAEMPNNDVYTKDEFISRAVRYWTIQTGMGMAFFLTAILAVLIGGAIVGQTTYARTLEHMRDYGTLRAIGADNRDINIAILGQAGVSAALGFGLGVVLALVAKPLIQGAGAPVDLPWSLYAGTFIAIELTCLASAYVSVRKVNSIDPLLVFRE